ncbi:MULTISPECIES: hypothetical protein [unclassified Pseudomonas]|uniref:hypothetical protein n=1 Tax=unclassified Pseudomonas TaxID=196821 RepID=UPI0015A17EE0|nr:MULTISPECIES: hypothetical protein [unclassified Pseudomonas]NVZ13091.1 hypothetical protein [Pseudomonas sp. IPO3775]NWA75746.1 hypothetical protein [Pseudomonas sp. C8002]
MIVFWVLVFVVGGVVFAYFLKIRFSGDKLGYIKLYTCLIVNGFFVVSYMDVIQYSQFLFLGYRPDLVVSYPAIEWVVFFGILAHAFALPMKWKVRRWFLNDKTEGD